MEHRFQEDLTPALAEATRRRAHLHDALVHAETTISSAAPGRLQEWTGDVTKALLDLRDAFDDHIEVTERPDGLYEEIVNASPRLAGKVNRLRDEHGSILTSLNGQIDALATAPDAEHVDDVRDDIQRLLGMIVRHRQHGADLVWEAYNLDIGGHE